MVAAEANEASSEDLWAEFDICAEVADNSSEAAAGICELESILRITFCKDLRHHVESRQSGRSHRFPAHVKPTCQIPFGQSLQPLSNYLNRTDN